MFLWNPATPKKICKSFFNGDVLIQFRYVYLFIPPQKCSLSRAQLKIRASFRRMHGVDCLRLVLPTVLRQFLLIAIICFWDCGHKKGLSRQLPKKKNGEQNHEITFLESGSTSLRVAEQIRHRTRY
mmetsp:Transcript_19758/g.62202  ORF Transcript_19758/g.62202 Transcript_19758/m.62202 type:complete len:126 (+) Transcript_19758:658-1035(+)